MLITKTNCLISTMNKSLTEEVLFSSDTCFCLPSSYIRGQRGSFRLICWKMIRNKGIDSSQTECVLKKGGLKWVVINTFAFMIIIHYGIKHFNHN